MGKKNVNIKYVKVNGPDVPVSAKRLTRGEDGLMLYWLNENTDSMVAHLAYLDDKLVGWSCYIDAPDLVYKGNTRGLFNKLMIFLDFYQVKQDIVVQQADISVYVKVSQRNKGIGKELLKRTLASLKQDKPGAIVRYGAPEDSGFFNSVFEYFISRYNLKPRRSWAFDEYELW